MARLASGCWPGIGTRLRQMVTVRLDRRLAARVDPSDIVQEALADAARGPGRLPLAIGPCRSTPGCAEAQERCSPSDRRYLEAKGRAFGRRVAAPGAVVAHARQAILAAELTPSQELDQRS